MFPLSGISLVTANPSDRPDVAPVQRTGRAPSIGADGGGNAGGPAGSALAAYAQTAQAGDERRPLTQVHEVMSTPALTVPADAPLAQALAALAERQIGQAPVLDAAGALVGLLLLADLAPTQPHQLQDWLARLARPVAELMRSPAPTVTPQTDLRALARRLLDTGLPGLPVTDDSGALVGVVSRADLLRALANDPPLDLWS